MNEVDLYKMVRGAIFAAPACPDGSNGRACVSCVAEQVTYTLIMTGTVKVDDFTMSDPSARV